MGGGVEAPPDACVKVAGGGSWSDVDTPLRHGLQVALALRRELSEHMPGLTAGGGGSQ